MLGRVPVHHYAGSFHFFLFTILLFSSFLLFTDNIALGTACGQYFRVGTLCCTDPGDSDIVELSN